MVDSRRMDRKMKSMLKGAGLQRLVGGELQAYADGKGKLDNGYVRGPPSAPTANVDDFAYYMEHGNPSTVQFENQMYAKSRDILVDRHQNETPEEFEKTKKAMIAGLMSPYTNGNPKIGKKNGVDILRGQWIASELQKLPFWKSAEKYVAQESTYRQPVMDRGAWESDVQRNITNWKTRVDDALEPQTKADLIQEFSQYQKDNASYDQYVAMNESKPPPPSFEGKDITEITKSVGERSTHKDKEEKLKFLRMVDDDTSHDVAQKVATLNGMKTGNLIADEEIDKTLAYIKWGEQLREQIAHWEREATKKDMELPDYYDSIGKPPLIDVEGKVAEENKKIEDAIQAYKKSPKYVWDQIKKWGLLVIDIGSNFLPYILPFPIGEVISLGYQAFAPQGSMYHTEGSFTDKLARGVIEGASAGLGSLIGLGRTGRRKYMRSLMEAEGGGAKAPALQIEDDSRSRHALHAKTPNQPQRRRKVQRQT